MKALRRRRILLLTCIFLVLFPLAIVLAENVGVCRQGYPITNCPSGYRVDGSSSWLATPYPGWPPGEPAASTISQQPIIRLTVRIRAWDTSSCFPVTIKEGCNLPITQMCQNEYTNYTVAGKSIPVGTDWFTSKHQYDDGLQFVGWFTSADGNHSFNYDWSPNPPFPGCPYYTSDD